MLEEILSKISFISPIFYQVLYMTVVGSIVGLLIYFVRNIFDKKISGKWKCIMWCIAIVTLLIPIRIEVKTDKSVVMQSEIIDSFENIKYINQESSRVTKPSKEEKTGVLDFSDFNDETSSKKSFENMNQVVNAYNNMTSIQIAEEQKLNTDIKELILNILIPSVWMFGILIFITTFISGSRRINKRISKNIYKDERLENILSMCKKQLVIKKKINIVLQSYKKVPSIFGILNPSILITEETLEQDNQTIKYIFLHELSHYKRKDLIFNYVLLCVLSIHWFNPVVWFLFKKIRQDIEIGADELASKKLDKNEKKEYGMVLINLLKNRTGENYTASMLCMSDTGKNMERRIHMIKGKSKSAILSFILVIIVFLVVVSFIFIKVIKVEDVVNVSNQNNLDSEINKEEEEFNYEIPEKVNEVGDLTLNITRGDNFSEGIAAVTINNEHGYYIDKKGNIVLDSKNMKITGTYTEGLTVDAIEVSKNKYKYGYVDKEGNIVIDYIYDEAYSFEDGLAPVKKDERYGYIDNKGNWILDFKYDGRANYFHEGLLWVSKDGKYGCIDKQGNVVIDFKYDGGFVFSEGLACVEKNGKYGYIDKTENVVIDYEYDDIQYPFSEGLALVYKDGKYKYIDKKGNVALEPPYQYMSSFSNGLAWVRDGDKYGFIDKQGNLAIDIQYDAILSSFSEGLACVEKNGKCAYINYDGKVIIGNLGNNTVSNELSKPNNNNEVSDNDKQKITQYIDILCNDGFSRKISEFENINDADKYWIYGHLSPQNEEYSNENVWIFPYSTKEELENELKDLFGPELVVNLEKDINENEDLLSNSKNINYNKEHNVYEFSPYGIYVSNYYAINSIKKNNNEFIVNVVEYMETDNAVTGRYIDTGKYYHLVYSTLNGDNIDGTSPEIAKKEAIVSESKEDIRKWADSEVLKQKNQFKSFNIILMQNNDGKFYLKSIEKE